MGKNRNEEIIININAAVKRLEQDYDIVIVGIPGACLSFNPQYSNDFWHYYTIVYVCNRTRL